MFPVYANGEVIGGEIINLAVIAAALFVILAALWSPAAPQPSAAPAGAAQQVVAVAPVAHAS